MSETYDLLVVGGGINGAGVARDAAGRNLSVLLCEKDDLGEGTSSRSGKYIHGGLRYLEYYEFRLVREALKEREVMLEICPHLTKPLRLVLPHSPEQRPRWLIRLGLFLYDNLGGRQRIPATESINLEKAPEGEMVRDAYRAAFAYWDVWVDDARLVIANALDAARLGATVRTRTECVSARREGSFWSVVLLDRRTGTSQEVQAKAIINTAGPWVEKVIGNVAGINTQRRIRLVKGSHIITKKWWKGDHGYVLQAPDRRLIFVNPYFDDMALIGTTDIPYDDRPEDVAIDESEVAYLIGILNQYFRIEFTSNEVLAAYSGVRPLFDDDSNKNASAVTRDYEFETNGTDHQAPIVSVFGGKLTTYRKLAEQALEKVVPTFPNMSGSWTDAKALPGGDLPKGDFDDWFRGFVKAHSWLPSDLALHYAKCYGSDAATLLDGAKSLAELGRHFGSLLYEREALWLLEHEWAETSDDVLMRRTKHGLFLSDAERAAFDDWMSLRAAA